MIGSRVTLAVAVGAALCFCGMVNAETLTAGTVIGNVPWEFQNDNGE